MREQRLVMGQSKRERARGRERERWRDRSQPQLMTRGNLTLAIFVKGFASFEGMRLNAKMHTNCANAAAYFQARKKRNPRSEQGGIKENKGEEGREVSCT